MHPNIITNKPDYPIKPEHINITQHFYDAFGNMIETEISASYIVRLCQKLGGWVPFTKGDIEKFYNDVSGFKNFSFNRLLFNDYIIKMKDGKFHITRAFVEECFKSSPAI